MALESFSPIWALGLMSGTSLDGIDATLIKTDGERVVEFGPSLTLPMPEELRERIRAAMQGQGDMLKLERDITVLHAEAMKALLDPHPGLLPKREKGKKEVAVIGFHGQTIAHRPEEGITWQMGDGALLAELTGIDVVCDFRRRDMAAGGQGAPLVPLFHAALAEGLEKPVAFLNIGGVANVTWIGNDEILAFDTGPGNAILNDWCVKHTGKAFDENGALALAGKADMRLVEEFMRHPYFSASVPKSLDRNHFPLEPFAHLSAENGAATLTQCMAASVEAAAAHFPEKPKAWYICGGGRHNAAIMAVLRMRLANVEPVENLGLDGDALEAQAFAYLAVRSLRRLPLSLPTTTGVTRAVTGGAFYPA